MTAFQDVESNIPNWRDLKNSQNANAVNNIQVPEQNPPVFHGKLSLCIPPIVLTAILEAKALVPADLIPILSAEFQEVDRTSPMETGLYYSSPCYRAFMGCSS